MKSGTNLLRGDGYYHYRDEKLSSNDFFLERAGRPKDQLDYKRYGFNVGGPVRLGGLYNGRDRTFFFSSVEWLYDKFPEPGQFTVPTEARAQRRLLGAARAGHPHLRPGDRGPPRRRPRRAPAVPEQHHPAEPHQPDRDAKYLKYYPLPNQAGDASA